MFDADEFPFDFVGPVSQLFALFVDAGVSQLSLVLVVTAELRTVDDDNDDVVPQSSLSIVDDFPTVDELFDGARNPRPFP